MLKYTTQISWRIYLLGMMRDRRHQNAGFCRSFLSCARCNGYVSRLMSSLTTYPILMANQSTSIKINNEEPPTIGPDELQLVNKIPTWAGEDTAGLVSKTWAAAVIPDGDMNVSRLLVVVTSHLLKLNRTIPARASPACHFHEFLAYLRGISARRTDLFYFYPRL